MRGKVTIIQGNARALPIPDSTVDLVVTSPPYFGLRSYTDGGEHYTGQVGAEATPAEFVDALITCTREMVRVLKPTGSIWVNLGDKYAGNGAGAPGVGLRRDEHMKQGARDGNRRSRPAGVAGIPPKSLMGLPWRYALRCIDDLGLILRAEVIWCLSGGARVYARTPTGDRPVMLRDLVRSYLPEDVQLWNGNRWTQVQGWNRTPDDNGALEFELSTGERIGCTAGHRWPTARGLLRAEEIRVGDTIQTTRLPARGLPRSPSGLPDDEIGWLVGLYIAEGSRSETTIQFAGHIREDARHARLVRIAEAYDGTCNVYQTSENGVTCNLRGSVLVGIIDRYVSAGTAKTKRLRHAAWQRGDAFLSAVVDGYLSGDGHYDAKNDRWRLGFTENDEWAADLRTIAARLGTVLRLRRVSHMMSGRTFPGWRGEWRWTRSTHHNAKADGEVVAIRRSRTRDFYDLGVADEPHLFALASGVLTHNSKPNGLPESVTDRVRRSHEQWFHFVTQPRYYSSVDHIRETHAAPVKARGMGGYDGANGQRRHGFTSDQNPLGKLPSSVWDVATQPLSVPEHLGVDHYAAFPTELPRRIISGWSPTGICAECGEGRRPTTQTTLTIDRGGSQTQRGSSAVGGGASGQTLGKERFVSVTGDSCACSDATAPTRCAVVLDPFGGTGTTALVASVLGRHGISVDMSADYCRLARWRTSDPGERARAMQVPKPPHVLPDQYDLFDLD